MGGLLAMLISKMVSNALCRGYWNHSIADLQRWQIRRTGRTYGIYPAPGLNGPDGLLICINNRWQLSIILNIE
jgi:hypothetical protein